MLFSPKVLRLPNKKKKKESIIKESINHKLWNWRGINTKIPPTENDAHYSAFWENKWLSCSESTHGETLICLRLITQYIAILQATLLKRLYLPTGNNFRGSLWTYISSVLFNLHLSILCHRVAMRIRLHQCMVSPFKTTKIYKIHQNKYRVYSYSRIYKKKSSHT